MSRLLAGVFVGLCIASGPGADAQYARVSAGSEVILAADVATTPGLGVRRGDFPSEEVYFTERRAAMVDYLAGEGIDDKAVLAAMGRVPRHLMIAPEAGAIAYEDHPIPIPDEQTISAPYIVGYMTMQLELEPGDRVLEIGTGSGYQTAVLAELAQEVVTIEIIESLARSAAERLKSFGYNNITVLYGDGFFGWPEGAPYDAIMVTAAAPSVPPSLIEQLKPGGRLILPVGLARHPQNLVVVEKTAEGEIERRAVLPVRFVPLTHEVR